ncbi:MAG: apolipoprotein N-acyltransferase [Candidatus Kapaibacterium sp.]
MIKILIEKNKLIKYAPILSGILLGLSFPPNPLGALFAGLGFIPILFYIKYSPDYKDVLRKCYYTMIIFTLLSSWWMGSWQANSDKFLILTCIAFITLHPLFYLPAFVIYKFVLKKWGEFVGLICFSLFWCFGEYLHSLSEASYPWFTIGNTQTYNLLYSQFIEYTGVWGLSLLILFQNSILTYLIFSREKEIIIKKNILKKSIITLIVIIIVPYFFGIYKVFYESGSYKKIKVTIIQPNINPWDKWNEIDTSNQIKINADLSIKSLKSEKTELFLWVETAIPYPLRHPTYKDKLQEMTSFVDSINTPILTGFADYEVYDKKNKISNSSRKEERIIDGKSDTINFDYFNSAGLFIPKFGLSSIYHKTQLVPFGERIPFIDAIPSLSTMLTWGVGISSWGLGSEVLNLKLNDSIKIGTVICIESIYPNLVRKFVDKGANLLTIITNDGWYLGTPGPIPHNQFAVLRAIENRRSIVRAANTGISCFINPYGYKLKKSNEGVKTTLTESVELRNDRTFYVKYNDWLPKLCGVISLLILLFSILKKSS